MEQTIEQRRDGGGVAQELPPVVHGAIRGDSVEYSLPSLSRSPQNQGYVGIVRFARIPHNIEQRGGFFIAAHHDFQEVLGGGLGQAPHPEVINEEQGDGGDLRDVLLAGAGELGLGEVLEEDVGLAVEDAMALLDHGEADGLGQVALARPGRSNDIMPTSLCA
jgi:hypothetical protein